MASYSLSCSDTGTDCPGSFTTEEKDELMEHVKLHAQTSHPEMVLDEATVQQVQGLIREG
jgi:predicted small metal-binding protein